MIRRTLSSYSRPNEGKNPSPHQTEWVHVFRQGGIIQFVVKFTSYKVLFDKIFACFCHEKPSELGDTWWQIQPDQLKGLCNIQWTNSNHCNRRLEEQVAKTWAKNVFGIAPISCQSSIPFSAINWNSLERYSTRVTCVWNKTHTGMYRLLDRTMLPRRIGPFLFFPEQKIPNQHFFKLELNVFLILSRRGYKKAIGKWPGSAKTTSSSTLTRSCSSLGSTYCILTKIKFDQLKFYWIFQQHVWTGRYG